MAETILDRIVLTKRKEVAQRQADCPLEQMQARAAEAERARNFFAACTRRPAGLVNVIAEVKKASPSAGVIRADFDPAEIARQYQAAGAAAISVLTDEQYFQGSLAYLTEVRHAVSLPVLRKDFLIDPYQVYEARAAGADAVLLIAECLKPGELMDLMILSASLKMTSLVEVHGMDSLMQMRSLIGFPHGAYSLLGINNRDLATFQVDVANTIRLAEMVPDHRTLVSESGIKTRDHVRRLRAAGVNSVLVGETLLRSDDIAAKFRELFAFDPEA
ncbi:MAG TPA: indole-3-glycerol phosphate synthase TrpC [Phycisphaerae bacterium]|nr:indole-3-glycerol phosphate synthase TrpC [Phycisphaerae bacterium]